MLAYVQLHSSTHHWLFALGLPGIAQNSQLLRWRQHFVSTNVLWWWEKTMNTRSGFHCHSWVWSERAYLWFIGGFMAESVFGSYLEVVAFGFNHLCSRKKTSWTQSACQVTWRSWEAPRPPRSLVGHGALMSCQLALNKSWPMGSWTTSTHSSSWRIDSRVLADNSQPNCSWWFRVLFYSNGFAFLFCHNVYMVDKVPLKNNAQLCGSIH